jgi:hypothetical protein
MIALLALATAADPAPTESCSDALPEHAYAYRLSKPARQSGVTPFHELHSKQGAEKANAGDIDGAAAHFRASAFFSSYSAHEWVNLGRAHGQQAERRAKWDAEAQRLLREAVACFDMAHWLAAWPKALAGRRRMLQHLQENYRMREACPADKCELYGTMTRVVEASPLDLSTLKTFCTEENLKVRVSDDERVRGFASAQTLRFAWLALKVCGVVAMEGAVEPQAASAAGHAVAAHFEETKARMRTLMPEILDPSTPLSGKASIQTAWLEATERSKLRFEVSLPLEPPYLDEALTSSEPVLSLVKGALRSRQLELNAFSYVVSMAGAPAQHWHTDVDPLFVDWRGEDVPPHGVMALVALNALTEASGPTEFVLGSHLTSLKGVAADELPRASFALRQGGAALFDMRIRRRGGANKSPKDCALLVVPYVHEWWQDKSDLKTPQTVGWDQHNTTRARKLFRRLDAKAWTSKLETLLGVHGVDLDDLRSTFLPYPPTDLYA